MLDIGENIILQRTLLYFECQRYKGEIDDI